MKHLKVSSCYAVAAPLLGVMAGSSASADGGRFAPTGAALDVSVPPQTAQLRKSGPVGTYKLHGIEQRQRRIAAAAHHARSFGRSLPETRTPRTRARGVRS